MKYLLFFSALTLAGCAGMTPNECRVANWYDLGERDGLAGNPARIETYAYQCERHNANVAREQYMDGWYFGNAEYRHRTAGTESS
jgi:hypothetical protein